MLSVMIAYKQVYLSVMIAYKQNLFNEHKHILEWECPKAFRPYCLVKLVMRNCLFWES